MAFATHEQMRVFEVSIEGKFPTLDVRAVLKIAGAASGLGGQIQILVTEGWFAADGEFQATQAEVCSP